jgi:hypothetical protein
VKKSCILVLIVVILFLVGELALFLAGLLPQTPILESISASMDQLESEHEKPYVLQNRERNGIDNFTDCEMLNLSYFLDTRCDLSAILTNPIYWREDAAPVEELEALLDQQAANGFYPNYCMGFRIWMRPMLTVCNYMEIRSLCGFTVWAFFGLSLITVNGVTKSKFFSALYALCIVALNPLAISASLTTMTCFLISFLGVIAIPTVFELQRPNSFRLSVLFLVLGAVTQFFDFYTYPLITFAFPMVVFLSAINRDHLNCNSWGNFSMMICGFGAWLFAYTGIWLLKLASTALFTSVDIWAIAHNAIVASIGVISDVGPFKTFSACLENILTPEVVVTFCIAVIVWVVLFMKNPDRRIRPTESLPFVVIGMISIAWILLAKRTYEHRFFQYRTLGVLFMAAFGFMAQTTKRKMGSQLSIETKINL